MNQLINMFSNQHEISIKKENSMIEKKRRGTILIILGDAFMNYHYVHALWSMHIVGTF